MKFFASRRIYAIKESETIPKSRKASSSKKSHESEQNSIGEDSEEEKWAPKKKKSEKFVREELQGIKEEVQNNSSTLGECKTMLQELIVVNKFLSLPLSVIKLVSDAFKCKICLKAPMNPPVIATRCCNVLLGCTLQAEPFLLSAHKKEKRGSARRVTWLQYMYQ